MTCDFAESAISDQLKKYKIGKNMNNTIEKREIKERIKLQKIHRR